MKINSKTLFVDDYLSTGDIVRLKTMEELNSEYGAIDFKADREVSFYVTRNNQRRLVSVDINLFNSTFTCSLVGITMEVLQVHPDINTYNVQLITNKDGMDYYYMLPIEILTKVY